MYLLLLCLARYAAEPPRYRGSDDAHGCQHRHDRCQQREGEQQGLRRDAQPTDEHADDKRPEQWNAVQAALHSLQPLVYVRVLAYRPVARIGVSVTRPRSPLKTRRRIVLSQILLHHPKS